MIGGSASRPASAVTLDNWQSAGQLAWSFQHIADIFPTAAISRGRGPIASFPAVPTPLLDLPVTLFDGTPSSVSGVLGMTETDGWLVLHRGVVLAEEYPSGMTPQTPHLLMSVSKSLIGTVAGALVGTGDLDPHRLAADYVPRLGESGYAGAIVRHLLDMRSGIAFSEDYLDPGAEVRTLEQAFGWAPRTHPGIPDSLFEFLLTLQQKGPHGGPFEYRSGESDVLGWVCEAATGVRMPELMSQLLWSRLGCEFDANIGVDSTGTGMFDGGISATLRDLARFGSVYLGDGMSLTGEQVVPPSWIADCVAGDPDSREAFASGPTDNGMPGGMYRNQFWFPYPDHHIMVALGIHGQMIYIHRPANLVAVKLSSWPAPQESWKLSATLRAFTAIADRVAQA